MSEVIPEGWTISTIDQLTANNSLFCDGDWVESKDQDSTGKNRLIQLADIGDGTFLNKSARFMNDEQFQRLKCTELRPNDILIARMPDPLGRACIYKLDSQRAATVVDVAILRTENANHYWLMSAINSPNFRFQIELNASGTTRTRIARGILSQIEVLTPPLPEQQKIATILSSVDDVIEKTRAQVDKLKDLKTGMMQELLTQGIGHTEFKDSPVGRIPNSWKVKSIGSLFFVQLGKMLNKAAKQGNAAYPYLGNKNVQWGKVDISELETMDFSSAEREKFSLTYGDLLICEGGDVGRAAIWRNELKNCYFQKAIHRLRPKDGTYNSVLLMEYLAFAKKTGRLMDYISQTSIAHLTKEKLESVPVPVPDQEEQRLICQASEGTDQNISKVMQRLDALLAIKKALMQDLLTGKVRVKLDPTEVAAA